jgi:hypothetical protein
MKKTKKKHKKRRRRKKKTALNIGPGACMGCSSGVNKVVMTRCNRWTIVVDGFAPRNVLSARPLNPEPPRTTLSGHLLEKALRRDSRARGQRVEEQE